MERERESDFCSSMDWKMCVASDGRPDMYIHDPFLFLVGAILLRVLPGSLLKTRKAAVSRRFVLAPLGKLFLMSQTMVLWLGVCPLLAGMNYHFSLSAIVGHLQCCCSGIGPWVCS